MRHCVFLVKPSMSPPLVLTLDLLTTNWPGYAVSQRVRKRVEEIFGWIKTVGNFRRTPYRGVERTSFAAYLVGAAYKPFENRQALSRRMNRVGRQAVHATVHPLTTEPQPQILLRYVIRPNQVRDSTLSSTPC
jgi:hypothetical protein